MLWDVLAGAIVMADAFRSVGRYEPVDVLLKYSIGPIVGVVGANQVTP